MTARRTSRASRSCRFSGESVAAAERKGHVMGLILFIILAVLLIGAIPAWPYSRRWGYYPTGILGTLLIVILLLALFNVIPRGF